MSEEAKKNNRFWYKFVAFLLVLALLIVGYEKYLRQRVLDAVISEKEVVEEVFGGEIAAKKPVLAVENEVEESFGYQLSLHNQEEVADLKDEIAELRKEILALKSQDKIAKMALIYVDLRRKIYGGGDYGRVLQDFELLGRGDRVLALKIKELREKLAFFVGFDGLSENFGRLVPDLVAAKSNNYDEGFWGRLQFNLAKIVTVRSLDEQDVGIDGQIVRVKKALKKGDCEVALQNIDLMAVKYRKFLQKFDKNLRNDCDLQGIDNEIMLYLESLT